MWPPAILDDCIEAHAHTHTLTHAHTHTRTHAHMHTRLHTAADETRSWHQAPEWTMHPVQVDQTPQCSCHVSGSASFSSDSWPSSLTSSSTVDSERPWGRALQGHGAVHNGYRQAVLAHALAHEADLNKRDRGPDRSFVDRDEIYAHSASSSS